METINKIGKSYKQKKAKKSPEMIKKQIMVEHNISSIKFLPEDRKTLLRKQCIDIVRKQYSIFKAPESDSAKAWSDLQYKRIFKELKESNYMIIDNVFK